MTRAGPGEFADGLPPLCHEEATAARAKGGRKGDLKRINNGAVVYSGKREGDHACDTEMESLYKRK